LWLVQQKPVVPDHCGGNAHLYYLLFPDSNKRERAIQALAKKGIHAVFHYVPLHDSPAGKKHRRAVGDLPVTREKSSRLLRLPLWLGLEDHQDFVIQSVFDILKP
jgi:dTDP-4-amino-4,6-dideoxygalactose transaminase